MFAAQLTLMTRSFRATALPWKQRSAWIGGSSACYFVLSREHWMWTVQAIVAFLSDYVYAGVPHVTHGIDRWLSTFMTLRLVVLTRRYMYLGVIPFYCFYRSKRAVANRDYRAYVLYHTLWHVSGPVIAASVLD